VILYEKFNGPSPENLKDEMDLKYINWLHDSDLNTRDPFCIFCSRAAGTDPLSMLLDKSLQKVSSCSTWWCRYCKINFRLTEILTGMTVTTFALENLALDQIGYYLTDPW